MSIQIEMEKARDVDDLWKTVCHALEILRFDRAELHLYPDAGDAFAGSGFQIEPFVKDIAHFMPVNRW